MRKVIIEDGLTVRFPTRDESFADGVELGMLATLMSFNLASFSRTIATTNVDQARSLAQKLGYPSVIAEAEHGGSTKLTISRTRKVQLRLVSLSGEAMGVPDQPTVALRPVRA